jgi:hypothetical protein
MATSRPRQGIAFFAFLLFDSFVALRNKLTLRSKQHRMNEKWIFGFVFVTAILAICWLLLL